MDKKELQKALSVITDEEIGRMLEAREGGRIAGRGDSPCTQGFYEKEYGLEKKKEARE